MTKNTTKNTKVALDSNKNIKAPKPNFGAFELGLSNFPSRRANNNIYIDKTALIVKLLQTTGPVFITRPRRFGKSLLCSTIEDLFINGLKNFDGLDISTKKLWNDPEPSYPVVKLSLHGTHVRPTTSDLNSFIRSKVLTQLKSENVSKFLKKAGIEVYDFEQRFPQAEDLLREVIWAYHDKTGKCFVIIIDEYDNLFNQVISNQSVLEDRINWFSDFYGSIKLLYEEGCLRFTFITGITRYSHTGILSGFNNLVDLSFKKEFCSLLGYTDEEVRQYFWPYIEYGADLFGISTDDYLNRLRQTYDGYLFADHKNATKVYNPWSIMQSCLALSDESKGADMDNSEVFDTLWGDTGALSGFFVNTFKRQLDNVQVNDDTTLNDLLAFMHSDLTEDFYISKKLLSTSRDPYTMFDGKNVVQELRVSMVQSGYYTIRRPSDNERKKVNNAAGCKQLFLTVPNQEVIDTLSQNDFWERISSFVGERLQKIFAQKGNGHHYFIDEMLSGDPNKMLKVLNERFVPLPVESHVFDSEAAVRSHLAEILRIANSAYKSTQGTNGDDYIQLLEVSEEKYSPTKGSADIFVASEQKNVVIELKLYPSTSGYSKETMLQKGLKQIQKQRYYDQFDSSDRDTLCYSIVFSRNTCRAELVAVFTHFADGSNSDVSHAKTKLQDDNTPKAIATKIKAKSTSVKSPTSDSNRKAKTTITTIKAKAAKRRNNKAQAE